MEHPHHAPAHTTPPNHDTPAFRILRCRQVTPARVHGPKSVRARWASDHHPQAVAITLTSRTTFPELSVQFVFAGEAGARPPMGSVPGVAGANHRALGDGPPRLGCRDRHRGPALWLD